jgi:hypothetical protein
MLCTNEVLVLDFLRIVFAALFSKDPSRSNSILCSFFSVGAAFIYDGNSYDAVPILSPTSVANNYLSVSKLSYMFIMS